LLFTSLLNMKPPTFVQVASAHKESTSIGQFCSIKHQVWKFPTFAGLTFLGTAIALAGVGVFASSSLAQSWARRGAPPSRTGVVSTNSGIGLNIRSGPGLHFAIIGGAPDGAFLDLTGRPVSADCYTWRRLTSGGWVATDFVDKFGSSCAPPPRDCNFGCGPIARPPVWQGGPYIVVVPPIGGNLPNQLRWVQQFIPGAFPDRALPGSFINAGSFSDYDAAQSRSFFLRSQGFDARVYFAFQNAWH
jgi:hypothetical protein